MSSPYSKTLALSALLFLFIASCSCSKQDEIPAAAETPYVVMVSFDGFRHDYVDMWELPNFNRLIESGARSEGLIPSYPSKTFPNHYTMVTGLYPGNHGLVDNTFYSRRKDALYRISDRTKVQDPEFYSGVPLWQQVQKHGMKSASYFWVGSEAPIEGEFPSYYEVYNGRIPNEDRITQVGKWLSFSKKNRPNFITLYFSLVDSESHRSGPTSETTKSVVQEADRLLGLLMDELDKTGLPVNLIITSDHGMYPVVYERDSYIDLSELGIYNDEDVVVAAGSTQAQIYTPGQSASDELYEKLKAQENNFTVYRKEETPVEWQYRTNKHIGDLIIVADHGYVTVSNLRDDFGDQDTVGVHGYSPYGEPLLNGIFYAAGPNIVPGSKLDAFENIHIYPLVTQILGIPNPAIDGDPEVLKPIYQEIQK